MSRALDLSEVGHGLRTERQLLIARLIREYDPNLSLRRIPESDPAFGRGMTFNPPRIFGVWEEHVAEGLPNWVFTIAEMSIDERLLARIRENDFHRLGGAKGAWDKFMALDAARKQARQKEHEDMMAERDEEMLGIAQLAQKRSTFRHRINGVDYVIGDRMQPVSRKHV